MGDQQKLKIVLCPYYRNAPSLGLSILKLIFHRDTVLSHVSEVHPLEQPAKFFLSR